MINKVVLMGRLVRDIEVKYTTGEKSTAIARFTVACDRSFTNKDGEREADFISCSAFGKTAEFIAKYFHKGDMIAAVGSIRTGSFVNKDGATVYTTDVSIEEVSFCGSKGANNTSENATESANNTSADSEPEDDGKLPF